MLSAVEWYLMCCPCVQIVKRALQITLWNKQTICMQDYFYSKFILVLVITVMLVLNSAP